MLLTMKQKSDNNYKCTGTWVNCMAAKINELEKTDYQMLGK
jgi:hypothetical protein